MMVRQLIKFEDIALFHKNSRFLAISEISKKQSIVDSLDFLGRSFFDDGRFALQLIRTGVELRNLRIKSNLKNNF
jgi:hypothetical protein